MIEQAAPYKWQSELLVTAKGAVLRVLRNAIIALRSAPEWHGLLRFNEFAQRITTTRDTPWGPVEEWTDQEDRQLTDWLQDHEIYVSVSEAATAAETVAQALEYRYHPVRDYLNALEVGPHRTYR